MSDQANSILRQIMPKWSDEDFSMAYEVEQTMKTPGWKLIEKLFEDQKIAIWQAMRKAKKEDNVWRLIGMMEGHEMTRQIPHRVLIESEKQRKFLNEEGGGENGSL